MSTRPKSFISRLSLYNFSFGTKINLLVYTMLVFSLLVISVVGFNFLRSYLEKSTYKKLEQITYHKKQLLEKEYAKFIDYSTEYFNDDLISSIEELKSAFKNYSSDRWMSFSADSIANSKVLLEEFYKDEFIGAIEWDKPKLSDVFPERDIEIVLQRTYIVDNKWPVGNKDNLINANTGASYDWAHQTVHTAFREFARNYKISNVYLIDSETGDVFYNLNKNILFGSNLFTGKFKNTPLASIYQEALSSTSTSGELFFADYNFFLPEYNKPVAFIAQPVLSYNDKVAVAVIEFGPELFASIVNDNWLLQNWSDVNINIVGADKKLRLNEIEQYTQTDSYFEKLEKRGIKDEMFMQAFQLKGGANIFSYGENLDLKQSDLAIVENQFNEDVFLLGFPLKLEGFDWSVVGVSSVASQNKLISFAKMILGIVFIILLIIVFFSLKRAINSIIIRLTKLRTGIIRLSKGESTEAINTKWNDEIGETIEEFNSLNERMINAGNFAMELSKGNYEQEFTARSENDAFAAALNTLNEKLRADKRELVTREKEDEISKWTNQGIAKFNDLLRQSNNDINALAYLIIEHLIYYLDAIQGGVFLVEGETDSDKKINLIASFAYDRKKFLDKTIEIGEGLIGNCYLEKKPIHLKEIPEEYMEITSGLGGASAHSLFIIPLMIDTEILGFIELASLNDFSDYQIKFIETLSNNIAATFSSVKLNTKTAELLEESKRRANEIAQQEEEMRQNMEEMQATQEELARLREEDEKNSNTLKTEISDITSIFQTLLNKYNGEVLIKDSNGVIIFANEQACNRYNTTTEAIVGLSDVEVLDRVVIEDEHALDLQVISKGDYVGYRTESVEGERIDYVIKKSPFYLEKTQETGTLTIWEKSDKDSV